METAPLLITLGALFIAALAADAIVRHWTRTGVLQRPGFGIGAGGSGLDLPPGDVKALHRAVITALYYR